jgi:putative transcriptional regulator
MSATIVSRFRVLLAEKELREQRRISLRKVVRETGVSISTVEGLANNTLREFPAAGLAAICSYLECTVGQLLVLAEEARVDQPGEERTMLRTSL